MKRIINIILGFALVASPMLLSAQQNFEEFTYENEAAKDRKAVPYPELHQVDVAWQKRIVRVIDSREKQNNVLNWPRNKFAQVIYQKVLDGTIIPYVDDTLKSTYTPLQVQDLGVFVENQQIIRPGSDDPYDFIDTVIRTPFDPDKIVKWRVMEDWIFDKKHSRMIVRIIALAPIYKPIVGGVELNEQALYWVRWDEPEAKNDLKRLLVNYEMFNRFNDATRLSFSHWFEKRMFKSYIIKKSNEYDYNIKDYEEMREDPMMALRESESISQNIFEMEHDLWEY